MSNAKGGRNSKNSKNDRNTKNNNDSDNTNRKKSDRFFSGRSICAASEDLVGADRAGEEVVASPTLDVEMMDLGEAADIRLLGTIGRVAGRMSTGLHARRGDPGGAERAAWAQIRRLADILGAAMDVDFRAAEDKAMAVRSGTTPRRFRELLCRNGKTYLDDLTSFATTLPSVQTRRSRCPLWTRSCTRVQTGCW